MAMLWRMLMRSGRVITKWSRQPCRRTGEPSTMQEDEYALKHATDSLRADRDVVLTAMQNGSALQYAAEPLRGDREV
eukprot:2601230-Amphidinium_carterae.1